MLVRYISAITLLLGWKQAIVHSIGLGNPALASNYQLLIKCPRDKSPALDASGAPVFCLPTSDSAIAECDDKHFCWFNGFNFLCCPNGESIEQQRPLESLIEALAVVSKEQGQLNKEVQTVAPDVTNTTTAASEMSPATEVTEVTSVPIQKTDKLLQASPTAVSPVAAEVLHESIEDEKSLILNPEEVEVVIVEIPVLLEPQCPGDKVVPLRDTDDKPLTCLPVLDNCPGESACWFTGINYFCCPMQIEAPREIDVKPSEVLPFEIVKTDTKKVEAPTSLFSSDNSETVEAVADSKIWSFGQPQGSAYSRVQPDNRYKTPSYNAVPRPVQPNGRYGRPGPPSPPDRNADQGGSFVLSLFPVKTARAVPLYETRKVNYGAPYVKPRQIAIQTYSPKIISLPQIPQTVYHKPSTYTQPRKPPAERQPESYVAGNLGPSSKSTPVQSSPPTNHYGSKSPSTYQPAPKPAPQPSYANKAGPPAVQPTNAKYGPKSGTETVGTRPYVPARAPPQPAPVGSTYPKPHLQQGYSPSHNTNTRLVSEYEIEAELENRRQVERANQRRYAARATMSPEDQAYEQEFQQLFQHVRNGYPYNSEYYYPRNARPLIDSPTPAPTYKTDKEDDDVIKIRFDPRTNYRHDYARWQERNLQWN